MFTAPASFRARWTVRCFAMLNGSFQVTVLTPPRPQRRTILGSGWTADKGARTASGASLIRRGRWRRRRCGAVCVRAGAAHGAGGSEVAGDLWRPSPQDADRTAAGAADRRTVGA